MALGPPAQRTKMIEEAAYYRAEQRQFRDGNPFEDWLAAEAEIDALLSQDGPAPAALEQRLELVNAELKAFRKTLASFEGQARETYEQGVATLARLRDRFRKRVKSLQARGEAAEDDSLERLEHLWREIAECMDRLRQA